MCPEAQILGLREAQSVLFEDHRDFDTSKVFRKWCGVDHGT
jgi:hypothetical protein